MDLNKVMIIGRLIKDPEMRTIPNGTAVCQLTVATNYSYTNQQTGQKVDQSEFHNIVLWRKIGEIAGQYLKKGSKVYIEGRLQTRSWDAQDGQKKYRTEIIGDNMIMLDSKGAMTGAGPAPSMSQSSSYPSKPAAGNNRSEIVDEELPTIQQEAGDDIRVEDIPF